MRLKKNQSIEQYVCTKIRVEPIFRYALIASFLLGCIIGFVLMQDYDNHKMAWFVFCVMLWLVALIIYFGSYYPFYRSVIWSRKNGIDLVSEINSEKVVISRSPVALIPYSLIAWVYLDPISENDSELSDGVLKIHCKDGTVFKIESNADDWYEIIVAAIPEVISGVGPEKLRQYLQMNPAVKMKQDQTKSAWGIVLLLLWAGLVAISIINRGITPMGVILQAALLFGGIWLLWKGKRVH